MTFTQATSSIRFLTKALSKTVFALLWFMSLVFSISTAHAADPTTGWWWNPSEPGTGYFIEIKNNAVFAASFIYSDTGAPVWYAFGPRGATGNGFAGGIDYYYGGQSLQGAYRPPGGSAAIGNANFVSTDATHGILTLQGVSTSLQRFDITQKGSLLLPAPSFQPETGWWWNANEGGRGFSLEVQGDNMFVAGFMYDSAGSPTWYVSQGKMSTPTSFLGTWMQCQDGKSITGPLRTPSCALVPGLDVSISFASTTTAVLKLPNGQLLNINRFPFTPPVEATLTSGSPIAGSIDMENQVNRYAVTLVAGTAYAFDLQGSSTSAGMLSNPVLRLFASDGSYITDNDDVSAGNYNSRIVYTPTVSGTYYLSAQGFFDVRTRLGVLGKYWISMAGGAPNVTPILTPISDSSYRNFKQIGLTPQSLPVYGLARAYANFSGSGRTDIFIAQTRYSTYTETPQTATPSRFSFLKLMLDGTYLEDTVMLSSNNGCIHPRKAIVADFNKDGRPDVFVACHGWDSSPWPEEKNKIVLSKPDGTYAISDASPDVGFFHGASAADLNGDGYPDVVLANSSDSKRVLVLLNKGDGTFIRESTNRLPTSLGSGHYYSIELLDINEDGALDLVLGGHEWEGAPTKVFLNPGNNIFGVSVIRG